MPPAEGPRIYNLFPLLAGPIPDWEPHIQRAAWMRFNWIFVNPFHLPGASGSIYSVKDYYSFNPLLVGQQGAAESQLAGAVARAHALGMQFMMDLVINHTATDSPLVQQHPDWYEHGPAGNIVHPGADEDGKRVVWEDLAAVDNAASPDRHALWEYWLQLILHYADMGFDGFRCDAAYQVPGDLWRFLISSARAKHPHLRFFAETLGCTPAETLHVARAGFDFVFNSSKWWDFTAPWCLEQYQLLSPEVPSISFPESHDTERLAAEFSGNRDAVRQRYLFATFFASGVMIPLGFEYGFRKRLHVVNMRPADWEEPAWDDTDFIRSVNELKAAQPIWNQEAPTRALECENPEILALYKITKDGNQRALVVLNKKTDQWQTVSDCLPAEFLEDSGQELSVLPRDLSHVTEIQPAGFRLFLAVQKH